MTANDITTLISSVGFPIVVCLLQIYINYNILNKTNDALSNLNTTISILTNEIGDLKNEVKK